MTFEQLNLNENISKALAACGYLIPTPIQASTIPNIIEGRDIVASAQTGTGKTAAFVLPALHKLALKKTTGKPRVLILTPTRELASQITTAATKYGKFLNFNIISLVGGMPYRQQLRDLSRSVDIIVATPGRLLDHMDNKRLDLSAVEMLVLDEADRMLDMGFIDDVKEIAKALSPQRQTLLFSATVDDNLAPIIRLLLKNPVRVDLSMAKMAPALIKQELYIVDNAQHKTRVLQHFMKNENIYKAIIFCATKIHCDALAKQLRDQEFEAAALHGDLKQQVRNKTIERFRKGNVQFLIATDVAARGIDINDVTHVINYDLPKFAEDYVHRIGRTGRAGKTGIAISLVMPSDTKHLQRIEKFISQKLEFHTIDGLEPTKKMGKGDTGAAGKKSRFGKSGKPSGNKFAPGNKPRGSYAKSEFSDKKKSFAGKRSEFGGGRREESGAGYAPKKKSYASDRSEESTGGGRPPRREYQGARSEERGRDSGGRDASTREPRGRGEERSFAPKKKTFGSKSYADAPAGGRRARGGDAPARESRDEGYAPKKKTFGASKRFDEPAAGRRARGGDAPPRRESRDEGYAPAPKKKTFGGGSRFDDSAPRRARPEGDRTPKKPASKFGSKPAKSSERHAEKPARAARSDNPKVSYGKSEKPFGRKTEGRAGSKPFAKKKRERS
jgi:superfamily II DNA/RNA helicase